MTDTKADTKSAVLACAGTGKLACLHCSQHKFVAQPEAIGKFFPYPRESRSSLSGSTWIRNYYWLPSLIPQRLHQPS